MKATKHRIAFRRTVIAAAAFLSAVSPAFAQDKATLDLLVKKGVITQAEADGVAKSSATVPVTAKDSAVKSLKLEGLIQTQLDWLSTDDKAAGASNPPATAEFLIRRAYFGALADLGNGWNGEIEFDFASGAKAAGGYQAALTPQPNFEKITITKRLDDLYGNLTAGYRKVNFTLEEYTALSALKPIERSILSNYFDSGFKGNSATTSTGTRPGFASRHTGIYWDGRVFDTGFFYGVAVTNGVQSALSYTTAGGLNRFAGWAYLGYNGTLGDSLVYKTGVNFGYTPEGNSLAAQSNSIYGYNPYVSLTYDKNWQLDAEFIQAVITNGRGRNAAGTVTERAAPYGFNLTPSYKLSKDWEIVGRYTYLFTDGRGTTISDVVNDGTDTAVAGTANRYNDAQSFYIGINWNAVGDSVKVLLGYEWTEFTHRNVAGNQAAASLTGPRADVSGLRARLQLQF
ncbi:MAG TPA: porin [Opitutales bacterium]|nr:porin [Opitutales bacterium]